MRYDVVTIVASRRGISKLRDLVSQLPAHFGIPIVCLAEGGERLVDELAAETKLTVKWAEPDEQLKPGHVYLPRPGASIVIREEGRISIAPFGVESAAMHPVDAFLSSAARKFKDRTLGIMLAAFPDDGAEGAHTLKWMGGTMLVLDRATAEFYGLADAIIKAGSYDRVLDAAEVAQALRATFTGRDVIESAQIQFDLGLALDSALRVAGTHMGNVQLVEPTRNTLHIIAHRGLGKEFLDAFSIVDARDDCACARALRLHQRVVIEDVLTDDGYKPYRDLALRTGYRAVQSTPFMGTRSEVLGLLSTHYPYPHAVSANEARNLDELAREAARLVARRD